MGSSPLARGLQLTKDLTRGVPRIIPARAGFTIMMIDDYDDREDHPRSRGVYQFQHPFVFKSLGSSPLARGLHLNRARRRGDYRIIPARAGFTQ